MSAAVADAMTGAEFATKQDLRDLEQRLTIRVGSMLVGVIVATMRLFPAH